MTQELKQEPSKTASILAINGGAPVRQTLLPYGRQSISDKDIEAVTKTLTSDFLTQGPEIEKFEKAVASAVGAKYGVAFNSGTAALHGAYFAAGLKPEEEVLIAPITFAATGNAALYLGGVPVFADVEPDTGNIDVSKVKAKISKKTKILVGIDFAGHPCEAEELSKIAKENGLVFIVDAAHSLGASYKGKKSGSLGDMSILSFHPVKTITTGEGGMVTTDDTNFYQRLLLFRTHGIEKNQDKLINKDEDQGSWYHEMQHLGFNYRMTDIQAALGTSQMIRLDEFIARRRQIANEYRKQLVSIPGIKCLTEKEHVESAYHLFPILITKDPVASMRKQVFEALRAENIGVQVHYIPVYRHPYYQNNLGTKPQCPNAEAFYNAEISLPMFPAMSDQDIADVVTALKKISAELLVD